MSPYRNLFDRQAEPFCKRTFFARPCWIFLRADLADLHAETYNQNLFDCRADILRCDMQHTLYKTQSKFPVSWWSLVVMCHPHITFFISLLENYVTTPWSASRLLCRVPRWTASSLFCNLTDDKTSKCTLYDVHIWIKGSNPVQGVKSYQTLGKWPNWRAILFYVFVSVLYMFRATSCSSSGE